MKSAIGDTQLAKRVDVQANIRDSGQLEDYPSGAQAFTSNDGATSNDQIDSADGVIELDAWQHLAASFDGTTQRLYVDGALVAEAAGSALAYDTHPLLAGCDDNGSLSEPFDGTLDDVQVYDRALSDAEIASLAAR